jgi:hypothetical protein
LKKISGIGPKIEARLNRIGIFHFHPRGLPGSREPGRLGGTGAGPRGRRDRGADGPRRNLRTPPERAARVRTAPARRSGKGQGACLRTRIASSPTSTGCSTAA